VSFTELCARVRAHLDQQHRYDHCVRVARLAETIARAHGESAPNARIAGMLHDLARLYSAERLLAESERRGHPIGDFERRNPIVLHAPLGAALARELFGVDDPAVLSAIAKHTVGAAAMSGLDCVLYLADGLEPGRNFPERERLVALAKVDLPAGMRATIASSLRYFREKGIPAAPQTAQAAHTFGLTTDDLEVRTA
jgi:predicted HD superfamily hydrolase involved in NAD metabolism